mmetsp:Transcript_69276/g.218896  ORF Transcript_69276/g.218896 Transcript_69276/m.218896 type:complete len:215 (+) Transcript_69276:96-740(+)
MAARPRRGCTGSSHRPLGAAPGGGLRGLPRGSRGLRPWGDAGPGRLRDGAARNAAGDGRGFRTQARLQGKNPAGPAPERGPGPARRRLAPPHRQARGPLRVRAGLGRGPGVCGRRRGLRAHLRAGCLFRTDCGHCGATGRGGPASPARPGHRSPGPEARELAALLQGGPRQRLALRLWPGSLRWPRCGPTNMQGRHTGVHGARSVDSWTSRATG